MSEKIKEKQEQKDSKNGKLENEKWKQWDIKRCRDKQRKDKKKLKNKNRKEKNKRRYFLIFLF